MNKKLLSLCVGTMLIGGVSQVSAQTDHYCGTDKLHQELLDTDPDYAAQRLELEKFTQDYTAQNAGKQGTVYVIPIVFHVIHNFGSENVSKQKILDGVRIINEDFRKTNADTTNIVAAFKGIAADSEIEFRLAQKDPNGNCTDGITRTVSSQTLTADDGVKNLVRWPNDRYLNVWLVNSIASGAGGYAYYPGASSSIDGIVLRAGQFGPGYRSLTHEIGHYLNLPHTWGNSNNAGVTSNCNGDDGVGDTPNTVGNTSCNLSGVSCGSLDNVQNYMEYSFCDVMFTEGQKSRMRAAINSSLSGRNNLWKNANLVMTGTDGPISLCNADFSSDQKIICVGTTVDFQDESFNGQSNWSWGFPGGSPATAGVSAPSITYNTPGIYDVSLSVTNGTDFISTTKSSYIVVQSEGDAMPLFESFENFDFASEKYWNVINNDQGNTWTPVDFVGYSGSSSLKMDNYSGNGDGNKDQLISPSLDLSEMQSAALTFRLAFAQRSTTSTDALKVYVSNNCGETWALLYVKSGTNLATTGITNGVYTPASSSEWQQHTIPLNPTQMVEGVKFKIEFMFKGGNNLYIDDINITGNSNTVPMLVSPMNGMADQNVTLTIDWDAVSNVDEYEFQIDTEADFTSPNIITGTNGYLSNVDNDTDTEHPLVNLAGSTTYYWRARTISGTVNSAWSATWEFTTISTVGIADAYLDGFNFEVYPNPTEGITNIEFNLESRESVEIQLVDLTGRVVQQIYAGNMAAGGQIQKIQTVDTPGIYFAKVIVGDRLFVKKLVVN